MKINVFWDVIYSSSAEAHQQILKGFDDGVLVYNTHNYWVFRLYPLSGILETRKHNSSETEYVSILR
jgi:hypothetical protein